METKFDIPIKASDEKQKIELFMKVLYKFHNLSDGLIRLVVEIVNEYYAVKGRFKVEQPESVIYSILFSTENREKIAERLGMTTSVFNTSLSKLRKRGVLTENNRINANFIPPKGNFSLNFKFLIDA